MAETGRALSEEDDGTSDSRFGSGKARKIPFFAGDFRSVRHFAAAIGLIDGSCKNLTAAGEISGMTENRLNWPPCGSLR